MSITVGYRQFYVHINGITETKGTKNSGIVELFFYVLGSSGDWIDVPSISRQEVL